MSFKNLQQAGFLAQSKSNTIELQKIQRKYNLDIGYMDIDKIVLAFYKIQLQKIFLEKGVFADVLLWFSKKEWLFTILI